MKDSETKEEREKRFDERFGYDSATIKDVSGYAILFDKNDDNLPVSAEQIKAHIESEVSLAVAEKEKEIAELKERITDLEGEIKDY